MSKHRPHAAQSLVRFAHITGIARQPKAAPAKTAKASAPRQLGRSTRVQSAGPAPASRFLHLNANLPPVRPQGMPSKRAAGPTALELAAQILSAGKPRPPARPCTKAEQIAAGIMATARKLQPGRF